MNNIIYTFGTPIYYQQLENIEEDKQTVLEFCNNHSNFRILGSSGNNLMSKDSQILDSLKCLKLKKSILEQVKLYADEIMGIEYDDIVITQCWVNQYLPNSYHHMHSHPNSIISANIWFKVSENCGNMTFEDPFINFRQIEPTIKKETPYNNRTLSIEPAEDFIVIFPSTVHHMVEKNLSTETRISLAINFWIKGILGKSEHYNLLEL